MYDGRDKNTNSQTNSSIKYISNTYGGVIRKSLVQLDNNKYVFYSMC